MRDFMKTFGDYVALRDEKWLKENAELMNAYRDMSQYYEKQAASDWYAKYEPEGGKYNDYEKAFLDGVVWGRAHISD